MSTSLEQDSIAIPRPDGVGYAGSQMRLSDDVFASDELNDKYNEHVKRKEEIRQRIEDLMREKEFLAGL